MLIIITIIMLAVLVTSLERSLLKKPLGDRAHDRYYPFPSYSRKTYYRKITFAEKEQIAVYDNFKKVQSIKNRPLQTEAKTPFLALVQSVIARKAPLRIAECRKVPGILVYTDNTQSPTHVFCMGSPASEIIGTGKCDIESELDQISMNIVESEKWSLNQVGLVLLMINLEYLPYVVWGKHGDYIVGWDRVDPIILVRVGDEVRGEFETFRAGNLNLCSIAEDEWDKRLFLCTIDSSSMHMLVKYRTPKSTFVVRFREKLNFLGGRSYEMLDREEKELVNKTRLDLYKRETACMVMEDRACFRKELKQFLQNLKEFVSDGTRFELS